MMAAALQELFSCLSRLSLSHARGHLRVSRFARRTTEKRETARSLITEHCIGIKPQDQLISRTLVKCTQQNN